jgi:hypothetical protein
VVTGYVPAWAAFLTGFLVLLFGGSFGVWVGFGLGLEHAERPGPGWEAAELKELAAARTARPMWEYRADRLPAGSVWQMRRPPVEVAHGEAGRVAWEDQAVALANSGSDEERVAAAMADLDVFMTRLLADHPEEGP